MEENSDPTLPTVNGRSNMADRWYFLDAGQVNGPVTAAQIHQMLAAGKISRDADVWPGAGNVGTPPANRMRVAEVIQSCGRADAEEESDWFAEVDLGPKTHGPAPQVAKPAAAVVPLATLAPPSPTASVRGRIVLGAATSIGRVRERNEDFFLTQQFAWSEGRAERESAVLVVADGMGSYAAGDQAARLTAQTVVKELAPLLLSGLDRAGADVSAVALADAVEKSLREANRVVLEQSRARAEWRGMGATAAVVLVWNGRAIISHVGDCRVYQWRAGKLTQLTRDQTILARQLELGRITAAEAAANSSRNEVTQCIGRRTTIEPSRSGRQLLPGDLLIVACDGLAADVTDAQMQKALAQPFQSPNDLAHRLISLAEQGGGTDNCTVAIAQYV
jgi:PPM family protein phosphatase